MSHWQELGKSDEWFTPAYIFDALGCTFDMDVAHPATCKTHVPATQIISANSLEREWSGFVYMNAPFGGRNGLSPWLEKFIAHGNGVALVPDRTSAPWFQMIAPHATSILFLSPKVKFERPDGSIGKSGTALIAMGWRGEEALKRAAVAGIGFLARPAKVAA